MHTIRFNNMGGRLGNSIHSYTLCVILQILFGYTYILKKDEKDTRPEFDFTDDYFEANYSEEKFKNNTIPVINSNICLRGFFQHDYLVRIFKSEICEFVKKHPEQRIHTAWNHCYSNSILIRDFLPNIILKENDVVVHLRLEDALDKGDMKFVAYPTTYDDVLTSISEKIKIDNIYWIMANPRHAIEKQYLTYLQKKWGGIYKIQSIEEDFSLMKKANYLVSSVSTLSLSAASYGISGQTLYIPICIETGTLYYNMTNFKGHNNKTVFYPRYECNREELQNFLDEHA